MNFKKKCLELNSGYMPSKIIDSDRAFILYLKGNAEIVHEHDEFFNLVKPEHKIKRPSVIRVKKYFTDNKFVNVKYSRENVFKRDGYTCVYCNKRDRNDCTVDHVLPRSKGGEDSFENCVTSCTRCNREKDDLTIKEWGREHPNPKRPHYLMLISNIEENIPDDWKKYLLW